MSLVDILIKDGWLKTPKIINAFRGIKRVDFLPENIENLAELNEALPIGYNQTISQPLVVAFMLELLEPREGEKILDIGSGSGWTSALLAHIVSQKGNSKSQIPNHKQIPNSKLQTTNGKVVAIELLPELKEFGEKNIAKYNFLQKGIAEFICADGSKGYPEEAPYDKILVSAAAEKCFPAWKEQLKIGGRIVTPIGSSIWLFVKNQSAGGKIEFSEKEYPGFVFVPLVENH